MRTVLLLASMMVAGQAWADALPKFPKNVGYAKARQMLISQGWQPVTMPNALPCYEGDDRCRGRKEVQDCSGTGLAYCWFTWRGRDGNIVVVKTVGESPSPGVVGVRRCIAKNLGAGLRCDTF